VFYAIRLRAHIDLSKYSESPNFTDKFSMLALQFTCLHVYKILLRLVGTWPCYDKNASACYLEHGKFRWFFGHSCFQGSVATYVRYGGMST